MKYVQPILYVCGNDELFMLTHIKEHYRNDYDVLAPYDYQRKHLSLLNGYVAPEYYKMCPAEDSQSETLKVMENSPYTDYFVYFLICFLKEEPYYNRTRFLMWLNKRHPVYIKERNFDVLKYYELKRYYQTIVIEYCSNIKVGFLKSGYLINIKIIICRLILLYLLTNKRAVNVDNSNKQLLS